MSKRPFDVLTPREREVLALLGHGLTNEEIAHRLGISPDGAKYHVSQILSKLGVATREEAAASRPEERPGSWARWPLWAKLGPAAAATAAALGVVGVIAMGWGGRDDVEDSLPGAAKVVSGGALPSRTPSEPTSTPTVSESATPTPSDIAIQPTPLATDLAIVEDAPSATPEDSPAVTPTPAPTSACPGPDYQGPLPWECIQGRCSGPSVSLSLDQATYRSGEAISVTLDAVNDSPNSTVLCYSSGQQFEIFIEDAGTEITNYSREESVPYTQAFWNEQVLPGWSQTRHWNWDQIVGAPWEQGTPLAPGTYEARGVWTGNCRGYSIATDCPSSQPVQFVVAP
jgi:DNA-binding CsgD family transcriptional regulator